MKLTLTAPDLTPPVLESLLSHDFVEIGILYSANPDGRKRYPEAKLIAQTLDQYGDRCSLHICGKTAREELKEGKLEWLTKKADRVQINGSLVNYEQELQLIKYISEKQQVIFQYKEPVKMTVSLTTLENTNSSLLVDNSAGMGRSPIKWVSPYEFIKTGFAGGLNPENLKYELMRIVPITKPDWWIDMETGLRDSEDNFVFDKAIRVIQIFSNMLT
jgi:phosphoribosylanthranilate isomerase